MALSRFQRRRRIVLAGVILAASLALLFVSSAHGEAAHEAIEAAGIAAILLGIAGRLWCTMYIGGRKGAEIVQAGPYSISRNPLYVFSTLAATGVGAQSGSLVLALVFMLGCWLAFAITIRREESYLEDRFGEDYTRYRTAVPRFWPDPRLFRDEATLSVPSRRLYVTLFDGLVFLAATPLFEMVEALQESGALGTILRLY